MNKDTDNIYRLVCSCPLIAVNSGFHLNDTLAARCSDNILRAAG